MPRPKTIDTERIRLEKIDKTIIEVKSCLQVELVFLESFTDKQWHTLQSYYRFEIDKENNRVIVSTNNSWKGLVMVLLSLTYIKYGARIPGRLLDVGQYLTLTMADTNYSAITCDTPYLDSRIERVAAPPSWKACYVRGNYKAKDIDQSLKNFAKLLEIDRKSSYIKTEYASSLSQQYKYRPITEPVDNSGLLCCYLEDEKKVACVEGLALISAETLDNMFGNRWAQGFSAMIAPKKLRLVMENSDDPMKPIPLYAYQVNPEHITLLCSYFPFLSCDFQKLAKEPPPYPYIIFDRIHLGKWG